MCLIGNFWSGFGEIYGVEVVVDVDGCIGDVGGEWRV